MAGSTPEPRRFYLTTPIYYVNDAPHIGHAYTTLACDVLARFKRLDGYDVFFLTGTDEHGQKVEKAAAAAGMDPQAFTDKVSQNFRELADFMNYSHDQFIRTTEPRHTAASQAIWRAMAATKSPKGNDNIYLGKYAGWYAVRDEAFYGEGELKDGPGGKKFAPSGAEVEWVEEPSYFFRLSDWQDTLLEFYRAHPDFIAPETRRNEVVSFVSSGLTDLSISRTTFKWGVPVPNDPAHIMYVWVDALTNYITAVGYPDENSPVFKKFWPADLHMVGKDILRFHAVYWPAFLMAAGLEVQKRVFAHGWWTNEGQKISKSLGNVIDPFELVRKYGLDPVRYFLLREVPFGNDGDFSRRAIVTRINSELANDLGNLAQRVLSMINRNCDGRVPELRDGLIVKRDHKLLSSLGSSQEVLDELRDMISEHQAFSDALNRIWRIVREANQYVDDAAPWTLKKTDPASMNSVLYVLAEVLRHLGILLWPFMPTACSNLLDQLAVPENERAFQHIGNVGHLVGPYSLKPGTSLPVPQPIFPRYIEAEEGAA